jgi:very-short-patch-repair endonuclease
MSKAEEMMAFHLKAYKIPFEAEYRFHSTRRWRFDFAIIDVKLAVEVEGVTHFGKNKNGTMKLGRHQTGKGMEADCEKYDEAMRLGWDIYRCTQKMVKSGRAIDTIKILYDEKIKMS